MTSLTAARPHPLAFWQWWVLTIRLIRPTLRNGELVTAIAASVGFTAGFYIPLHRMMTGATGGMSSYAQYLMPLIGLQAVYFAAMSTTFRSATDAQQGINRRYGSMPIAPLTPVAARMSASMYRCMIGLTVAIICGYVIGFRFHRSLPYTVGFCLLLLAIGMTMSLLADAVGTMSRNPEATMQWMLLPQMILGMISVGIQPAELFPHRIQPIVRNQFVSQFVYALRALAGDTTPAAGSVTWSIVGPSLLWLLGLITITVPLSVHVLHRRR